MWVLKLCKFLRSPKREKKRKSATSTFVLTREPQLVTFYFEPNTTFTYEDEGKMLHRQKLLAHRATSEIHWGKESCFQYGNTLPQFSDFLNSFMLLLYVVRLLL